MYGRKLIKLIGKGITTNKDSKRFKDFGKKVRTGIDADMLKKKKKK